jgi:hypothetical protein
VVQEEYRKAVVRLAHDSSMSEHLGVSETSNGILAQFYWHSLTFGPGLFQDGMLSPHLYLDRFVFLVYEITRHIAMQQMIVDISQEHCFLIQQHLFL